MRVVYLVNLKFKDRYSIEECLQFDFGSIVTVCLRKNVPILLYIVQVPNFKMDFVRNTKKGANFGGQAKNGLE